MPLFENPWLSLAYEPAFASLGEEFYEPVQAAVFPMHRLRFRNDALLPMLNLDPAQVSDAHFLEAFGRFEGRTPLLAMSYHGYQFGEYNARLGDGRGFLYGQVRSRDGSLLDLGTKGSGTTPYSRGGDGRLTLKGGIREVLAAEALHALGVRTSRCLCLIETGESLWRGDEPSPTRSSVMVRVSRSHLRFGTLERLHFLKRPDLIRRLLDHGIATYYPEVAKAPDPYPRFYEALVQRMAELVAQWMAAGFCHGVLNTDNMSLTGESFDYGPYRFLETYDLNCTAAYFDYWGVYRYGQQPSIVRLNLEALQRPLAMVMDPADLEAGLASFEDHYHRTYAQRILNRLGFSADLTPMLAVNGLDELLSRTITLLQETPVGYHDFFRALRQHFSAGWRTDPWTLSLVGLEAEIHHPLIQAWQHQYQQTLQSLPMAAMPTIAETLRHQNPAPALVKAEIEAIWDPITQEDDWGPFADLLRRIRALDPS